MFVVRDVQPGDYVACAAIANAIDPEPVTAEQMQKRAEEFGQSPDMIVQRLIAEDPAGQIVGYAVINYYKPAPDQGWYVWVAVHPDHRRQGAGTALWDATRLLVRERGATKATSRCAGTDDESFAWAQRRGFHLERERTESVLDLTTWDGARFAGQLDRVRTGGLQFATMRDLPDAMLPEIYAADVETLKDHPEYDGTDYSYDSWLHSIRANTKPQFFAFAMDGERVAGYSVISLPTAAGAGAYSEYTCVRRAYRGRGVALAVKLLTVEEALSRGVTYMRTNNNPENGPMLAVNEKLGYKLIPGPRLLASTLA